MCELAGAGADASKADAVVVAETKLPAADCLSQAEAGARTKGWNVSILPCSKGEGGGASAGVAVGVRGHVGMMESHSAVGAAKPKAQCNNSYHWVLFGGV